MSNYDEFFNEMMKDPEVNDSILGSSSVSFLLRYTSKVLLPD